MRLESKKNDTKISNNVIWSQLCTAHRVAVNPSRAKSVDKLASYACSRVRHVTLTGEPCLPAVFSARASAWWHSPFKQKIQTGRLLSILYLQYF